MSSPSPPLEGQESHTHSSEENISAFNESNKPPFEPSQLIMQQPESLQPPVGSFTGRSGNESIFENTSRERLLDAESDDESDESSIKAPRGRLAAQLRRSSKDTSPKGKQSSINTESAYDRIKRQLMGNKVNTPIPENLVTSNSDVQISGESDQEDFPVKRQRLKRRSSIIVAQPAESEDRTAREESPGSPSLFVSPFPSPRRPSAVLRDIANDSESDTSEMPALNPRLQNLIAERRKARLEKERAVQEHAGSESSSPVPKFVSRMSGKKQVVTVEAESDEDRDVGHKLTQQARPTRKASKKALEEMKRETQRISRNMQLTHQVKTKIKFSQDDFFSKFNFKRQDLKSSGSASVEEANSSSPPPSSDAEIRAVNETPPSTPGSIREDSGSKMCTQNTHGNPTTDIVSGTGSDNKGNRVVDLTESGQSLPFSGAEERLSQDDPSKKATVRRLEKTKYRVRRASQDSDDDDELEIVEPQRASNRLIFNQVPKNVTKESHVNLKLRALAQLNDRSSKRLISKESMTPAELNAKLQENSRRQALLEREENIQRAREKGMNIRTTEEKEREQLDVENILEMARKEVEDIAKREKEAAKKEGRATEDESGILDSEDDSEWAEDERKSDADEEDDEEELELSGSDSEEEVEEDDEEEKVDDREQPNEPMFDQDTDEEDQMDKLEVEADEREKKHKMSEVVENMSLQQVRSRIRKVVDSDDEDEGISVAKNSTNTQSSMQDDNSVNSAAHVFGFANAESDKMALSQIFAGTMAETQTQAENTQLNSLEYLRSPLLQGEINPSTPPIHQSQDLITGDSQIQRIGKEEERTDAHFDAQSQMQFAGSQVYEMPDATQDVGFQEVADSQLLNHISTRSTVDTVLLNKVEDTQSVAKRKGRLRRRVEVQGTQDSPEEVEQDTQNAFLVMQDASKRPSSENLFNKKASDAKNMVEEQAEESEDEYAGLGGASDDESTGDLDEDTRKMIDDDSNENLNEREIAAFHADKSRADDEKDIANLYKDIVNGGLRRKRGADMDLWDPDDEDEIAARRRAHKQREFAKMRKALLADEKLGKIAGNPKQAAFLQAIEDRADDDLDILNILEDSVPLVTDSQNESQAPAMQILTTISGNKNKRDWDTFASDASKEVTASQEENRLPPSLRRKSTYTKPTSLLDIRNTLSELIGEPDSIAETQELLSSEESADEGEDDEDEMNEADRAFIDDTEEVGISKHGRRAPANAARSAVIDRMALKRAASSSVDTANNESSDRLAFQASTKSSSFSFKVPSLLRRATNSSTMSNGVGTESEASASRGVSSSVGMSSSVGANEKQGVKMGGSKKSSVNYYVREQERKSRLDLVEKERIQGRERVVKLRRKGMVSALGVLVSGKFA